MLENKQGKACKIYIGTSGYSFKDWKGTFYPDNLTPGDYLEYYARHFNIVEVNASFYRILPPQVYESMMERVQPDFQFVVKAFQDITHKEDWNDEVISQHENSVRPLVDAGRLAGLLFQFPYRFRNFENNRGRLSKIRESFKQCPVIMEFRHEDWIREELFKFLSELGVSYCTVDMPRLPGLPSSIHRATNKTGYIRWHGRNKGSWWGQNREERYHYNYSREELEEWIPKIRELIGETEKLFCFFNNCHLGNAAHNALLLKEMLKEHGLLS